MLFVLTGEIISDSSLPEDSYKGQSFVPIIEGFYCISESELALSI